MALPKVNTPTYELVIPSTQKKVEYRPYRVKEEKILLIALESNDEKQIIRATKNIIKACLFDEIDVDKLATFDMEYIFTKLRIKSVGESSKINIKCEKCEEPNQLEVDLENELKIEGDLNPTAEVKLTDKISVIMKYPNINDVLHGFNDTKGTQIDKVFALIMACIDVIKSGDEMYDARDHSREELNDFVESLNSSQFKKIQEFIESMPQVVVPIKFTCTSCGTVNDTTVKGLSNFFG